MGISRKFEVEISVINSDAPYLNAENVERVICEGLATTVTPLVYAYVASVKLAPKPEDLEVHSKIGAVKRIRTLLDCSLIDAKFLADTAEDRGSSKWGTVRVERVSELPRQFRVIDAS